MGNVAIRVIHCKSTLLRIRPGIGIYHWKRFVYKWWTTTTGRNDNDDDDDDGELKSFGGCWWIILKIHALDGRRPCFHRSTTATSPLKSRSNVDGCPYRIICWIWMNSRGRSVRRKLLYIDRGTWPSQPLCPIVSSTQKSTRTFNSCCGQWLEYRIIHKLCTANCAQRHT